MRLSARRMGVLVIAAAGLAFLGLVVLFVISAVRGGAETLGYAGVFLTVELLVLVPVLLVLSAVLAIRRRPVTRVETVMLLILGATITLVVAFTASEQMLLRLGPAGHSAALLFAALGWIPIAAATLVTLVTVIVQTIRAPGAELS